MQKQKIWYHGSPLRLTELLTGSTITQDRQLAEIFSHKPTLVSLSDSGEIKHNGREQGYLYVITDTVGPEDVYPHPESTMPEGLEWLTRKPLRVGLLGEVEPRPEELITAEELQHLRKMKQNGSQ